MVINSDLTLAIVGANQINNSANAQWLFRNKENPAPVTPIEKRLIFGDSTEVSPAFESFFVSTPVKEFHEQIASFIYEDFTLILNTHNDRFTIRIIKKFFRKFEKEIMDKVEELKAKENNLVKDLEKGNKIKVIFSFEDMAKTIREIVERIW